MLSLRHSENIFSNLSWDVDVRRRTIEVLDSYLSAEKCQSAIIIFAKSRANWLLAHRAIPCGQIPPRISLLHRSNTFTTIDDMSL
jgi:hypothetical protein